jgi:hypothetical protein
MQTRNLFTYLKCIGKIKRHFPKIKIHDALYFPY